MHAYGFESADTFENLKKEGLQKRNISLSRSECYQPCPSSIIVKPRFIKWKLLIQISTSTSPWSQLFIIYRDKLFNIKQYVQVSSHSQNIR
jgi:hypothetical protein